ncbi:hypothetical protein BX666DRAFT_2081339 [Dichotomocladium elegans]|nr:hypothetical protein BX666DRAFT_2081339 [Dichotomocladium elegans]
MSKSHSPYPNAPSSSAMAWSFSPTSHGAAIAAAASGSHYPGTQHRDSFVHRQELESMFYQDLVCCNKKIQDLHELLRHYEDYHHNNQPPPQPQPMDQDDLPAPLAFAAGRNSTTNSPSATNGTALPLKEFEEESENPDSMMPIIPGMSDDSEEFLASMNASAFNPYQQNEMVQNDLKPYKCTIPGCQKAYKNPNGLKYHREHGHTASMEDDELIRPFRCILCNKGYRQMSGLKYHMTHGH